jgi:hypothetical protein
MNPVRNRFSAVLGLLVACAGVGLATVPQLAPPKAPANPPGTVDFLRDIQPIFAARCVSCHGSTKQQSGLRLDRRAAALQGGNSGAVIVPGKSAASRLYQVVAGLDRDTKMPPSGKPLTAAEVQRLRDWIDQGAHWPADTDTASTAPGATHWAFRAPQRPTPPPVRNAAWVRNPIDAFILARLEAQQIAPSPEADRATLIRRLSLDLTGLPPTPAEVDAFLADKSSDAYEKVVDRLLASPHYGERWGRHWLDAARYADSNGFSIDSARSIWKYRDWVIAALNRDLPFDRFTVEQIAGDLLPGATTEQKVATGFQRNTLTNEEGGTDREQFRVEAVVDRVNTLGTVYLGLTVGCAQCHDHKYDPISQREYYQLFAFYNNADESTLTLAPPAEVETQKKLRTELTLLERKLTAHKTDFAKKQPAWEKGLTDDARGKLSADVRAALAVPEPKRNAAQKKLATTAYLKTDTALPALEQEVTALKKNVVVLPTTLVLQERPTPRVTNIHLRGDFLRKGVPVTPTVPAALHALPQVKNPTRLDLARWLVDAQNPLTARVTVNRMWQHHFGRGLVETENDFGTRGAAPTHPELLDWLATEFVLPSPPRGGEGSGVRGWSLKALHKLIVTSATYRQSSRQRPELHESDPQNRLLARQNRLRLEAEIIRDEALAASGLFVPTIGGPSVFPPQPAGADAFTQANKNWKAAIGPDRFRRGMYTHFWRSAPHPALTVFDAPDSTTTCTRRSRSNTPLQALTLANDQAFFEFAQGLAARVLKECGGGDAERLRHAFRLCLAREPSAAEARVLGDYLARQLAAMRERPGEVKHLVPAGLPQGTDAPQLAAWTLLSRVLLNLDEFITRE